MICGTIRGLLIQLDGFVVLFCCKHYPEKIITLLQVGNATPLGDKVAFIRHAIPEYQEFCNVFQNSNNNNNNNND